MKARENGNSFHSHRLELRSDGYSGPSTLATQIGTLIFVPITHLPTIPMADSFQTNTAVNVRSMRYLCPKPHNRTDHIGILARLSQLQLIINWHRTNFQKFGFNASPLVVDLAKAIHSLPAPTTRCLGYIPDSSVSIWRMGILPGVGYLTVTEHQTRYVGCDSDDFCEAG